MIILQIIFMLFSLLLLYLIYIDYRKKNDILNFFYKRDMIMGIVIGVYQEYRDICNDDKYVIIREKTIDLFTKYELEISDMEIDLLIEKALYNLNNP